MGTEIAGQLSRQYKSEAVFASIATLTILPSTCAGFTSNLKKGVDNLGTMTELNASVPKAKRKGNQAKATGDDDGIHGANSDVSGSGSDASDDTGEIDEMQDMLEMWAEQMEGWQSANMITEEFTDAKRTKPHKPHKARETASATAHKTNQAYVREVLGFSRSVHAP